MLSYIHSQISRLIKLSSNSKSIRNSSSSNRISGMTPMVILSFGVSKSLKKERMVLIQCFPWRVNRAIRRLLLRAISGADAWLFSKGPQSRVNQSSYSVHPHSRSVAVRRCWERTLISKIHTSPVTALSKAPRTRCAWKASDPDLRHFWMSNKLFLDDSQMYHLIVTGRFLTVYTAFYLQKLRWSKLTVLMKIWSINRPKWRKVSDALEIMSRHNRIHLKRIRIVLCMECKLEKQMHSTQIWERSELNKYPMHSALTTSVFLQRPIINRNSTKFLHKKQSVLHCH